MTFRSTHGKIRTHTASELLFGVFAIFCLLLILRNTEVAVDYMTRGLLLCARTVIPSLFPFMILSELILSSRFLERPLAVTCAPLRRLLRLPSAGCAAILLGLLCGFPVGARCAIAAYERGELSRTECERVLGCASPPSSAFVIGAVGVSLWESRALGTVLYLAVVLSSLLTGILTAGRQPRREHSDAPAVGERARGGVTHFTQAVRASTESMLLICAYVVFFSALTGTLGQVLCTLGATETLRGTLTALFEMSSGVSALSALKSTTAAVILSAAALGWSGLSVHCQMLALCNGHKLSLRVYFVSKLLQAALCALMLALLLYFFPALLSPLRACTGSIYLL